MERYLSIDVWKYEKKIAVSFHNGTTSFSVTIYLTIEEAESLRQQIGFELQDMQLAKEVKDGIPY